MSEKYRSKVHMVLLYPDDPSHVEALDKIKSCGYDYALVKHDRDIYTTDDAKVRQAKIDAGQALEPIIAGTKKKEHYHIVIRTKNATWSTAICKALGIKENYLQDVRNFDNALMYLIHYNEEEKTQYNVEEVTGPLVKRLKELLAKGEKSEGEKVVELIEYIESCSYKISITDFAKYCAANGYWSEFRRSGSIFLKILEEHNYTV